MPPRRRVTSWGVFTGRFSEVRYDPDLPGFVLRCARCATKGQTCFWPLELEFWDPKSLQRCRACNLEIKRLAEKARRRADPEAQRRRNRAWNRLNRDRTNMLNRERRAAKRLASTTTTPGSRTQTEIIHARPDAEADTSGAEETARGAPAG